MQSPKILLSMLCLTVITGLGIVISMPFQVEPRPHCLEMILSPKIEPGELPHEFSFYPRVTRGHINILAGGDGYYVFGSDTMKYSVLPDYGEAEGYPIPPLHRLDIGEIKSLVQYVAASPYSRHVFRLSIAPKAKYGDLVFLLDLLKRSQTKRYAVTKITKAELGAIAEFRRMHPLNLGWEQ